MLHRTSVLVRKRAQRHRLLGDPTRLAIFEALRHADRTVTELSDLVGMHPNTVRSHIRLLKAAGLLETRTISVAPTGRPANLYKLVDEAATFDPEWPLLLDSFATTLRRRRNGSALGEMEQEGVKQGRELAAKAARGTGEPGLARLAAVLRRSPFSPQVRTRQGRLTLEIHSCPFWGDPIERNGDLICRFHLGLLRGAAEVAAPGQEKVSLLPLVRPDLCVGEVQSTG